MTHSSSIFPARPTVFQLHRSMFAGLALCSALTLAGCDPNHGSGEESKKENPTILLNGETLVKKVCLEGVVYYATQITDSVDSVASKTFWIVGGAAFHPGSSIIARCEPGMRLDWHLLPQPTPPTPK